MISDTLSARITQNRGDQFCVHVLGQLMEFVAGETNDVAVGVVIGHSGLCGDTTANFYYNKIALGDEAVCDGGVLVGELGTQRREKLGENGLFATIGFGPFCCTGDGPADLLGEAFHEWARVAPG